MRAREGVFGLRLLDALGERRRVRILLILLWPALLVAIPTVVRPDLLFPGDFGSDSSNYLATAQRAAVEHPIYSMSAGDRPTSVDNPPEWSVPILSPPTVAILWLPATLLPEALSLYGSWAVGLAAVIVLGVLVVTRAQGSWVILTLPLLTGLATTAWSGNLNAFVAGVVPFLWLTRTDRGRREQIVLGAVVGALAAVKLAPIFLVAFLVGQRRWAGVVAGGTVALVLCAAAVIVVGYDAAAEYLALSRSATSTPAPGSLPALVRLLPFPEEVHSALYIAALGLLLVVIVMTGRYRPKLSLMTAIVAVVFATPVLRLETAGVLVTLAVPWLRASAETVRLDIARICRVALVAVAGALVASIAMGGATTTSLTIVNGDQDPVVVRFELPGQDASFGYLVPAGAGLAWHDRVGTASRAWAFDAEGCRLLDVLELRRSGDTLSITDTGQITTTGVTMPARALAYSPRCAIEMKLARGG